MPEIIAIANQKGGVGKTTTAVNLSACLAAAEKKTLLVDFDPQGNATSGIGIDKNNLGFSVYDLLTGTATFGQTVRETAIEHLYCLPSNRDLCGAEIELVDEENRHARLRNSLANAVDGFDYCIIDAPPSLELLTVNALCAAPSLIIPVQCEYYALEGLSDLMEIIDLIKASLNPQLKIAGVLLTMFDGRTNLCNQVAEEIRAHFGDLVYRTVIPRSIRLSEAPSFGKPIILYDFKSAGARAYISLCEEVLNGRQETSPWTGPGSPDPDRASNESPAASSASGDSPERARPADSA